MPVTKDTKITLINSALLLGIFLYYWVGGLMLDNSYAKNQDHVLLGRIVSGFGSIFFLVVIGIALQIAYTVKVLLNMYRLENRLFLAANIVLIAIPWVVMMYY